MGSMGEKLAAAIAASTLQTKPHNIANPEDAIGCCRAINKAFAKGELDATDKWACPQCGMDWKCRRIGEVRYWTAQPIFMLWK